jgi:Mg/Co/Ni transporter MgtE
MPEWKQLPDKQKVEVIKKATDQVRSKVREALQPQLLDRAVEERMKEAKRELKGAPSR